MNANDPVNAWRDAVGEELPESSGRDMASWKDKDAITEILARLAGSGRCFVFGGTALDPKHLRRSGALTAVEVLPDARLTPDLAEEGDILTLQVGTALLRLHKESLSLNFIPHPADTADSGFLLSAKAVDAFTHAWDVLPDGGVQLVLGEEHGLLIGAARAIRARRPMFAAQLIRSLAGGIYRPGDKERLRFESQNKQLVKAAYEKTKGAHRSGAMDQADVDFVAWELLQHGLQPTIELMREIHGSGSPSALHPKLKVFYGKLVDEYLTPLPSPAVPEPVRHIWEQLVAASRETAVADLQTEVDALANARARVEEHEVALARERAEIVAQQRSADAASTSREAHIAHLESELGKTQTALAQAQNTIAGDADQLAEARTELRHARVRSEELTSSLSERAQQLETLNAEIEQMRRDAITIQANADTVRADLTRQRDISVAAGTEQARLRDASERKQARISKELDTALHEITVAADKLSAKEGEFRALQAARKESAAAITTLRRQTENQFKQLSNLKDQNAQQQSELATTRAEYQAVVRERDRLDALLIRLGKSPSDEH